MIDAFPLFPPRSRLFRLGSIKMMWVSGTNPAVSLPDLNRIRSILSNPELFVVTQGQSRFLLLFDVNSFRTMPYKCLYLFFVRSIRVDIFLTETAQLSDVVLPAAMWGEKTGIYTNVDVRPASPLLLDRDKANFIPPPRSPLTLS
jgi:ferredoxin-nitrate reductase